MPISALNSQTPTASPLTAATNNTLGQQDFLKLLTAQMSNQDPLSPMSNEQFIAQMAQISTLQSSQDMGKQLVNLINTQQRTQALQMVGRDVDYLPDGASTPLTGRVGAVLLNHDTPTLMINGQQIPFAQIQSVR